VSEPAPDSRPSLLSPHDSELPKLVNSPVAPETRRGRRIALAMVLMLSFLTVAWIASPLWIGILLGTVMAFTAQPLYRSLAARIGNRRSIAASLVTALGGLLTLFAGFLAVYILMPEIIMLAGIFQKKILSDSLSDLIGARGANLITRLGVNNDQMMQWLRTQLVAASEYAAGAAGAILQATTTALLSLVIGLMTMYYVLLEWARIAERLEAVLPLDPRHTRALMLEFRDVGRSSFVGAIATAMVQGLFGWIGYGLGGVPHPITFGLLTALASFLPVVGTALVWGTLPIYLLVNGRMAAGIFVLVWGLVVVMAISDYIIRPRLVGKDHGHPLLMLFALLGGIEAIGLAGLIVAPILMSLFLAVLRIYERETASPILADPRLDGPAIRTPTPAPVRIIEVGEKEERLPPSRRAEADPPA
jgi:predicted PurR-regulated permease PerM